MVLLARNQDPSTLGRASFFRKEIGFRLLAFQMLLLEHISTTAVADRLLAKISTAVAVDFLLEESS